MDNIVIRKAIKEDKTILNHLFEELLLYERKYDSNIKSDVKILSYFDKRIDLENNIILVALVDDKIIGYIYGDIDIDNKVKKELEANIHMLYITEEYRNKKIGTNLLNEMINIFKQNNVKYVFISNLLNNDTAKHLYEKLGFDVVTEKRRKEIFSQ